VASEQFRRAYTADSAPFLRLYCILFITAILHYMTTILFSEKPRYSLAVKPMYHKHGNIPCVQEKSWLRLLVKNDTWITKIWYMYACIRGANYQRIEVSRYWLRAATACRYSGLIFRITCRYLIDRRLAHALPDDSQRWSVGVSVIWSTLLFEESSSTRTHVTTDSVKPRCLKLQWLWPWP
jgi:hypothetical protein